MRHNSLHIIQKEVLDITFSDIGTALEWETRSRHGFVEMVKSQLERCFDEFDRTGDHLVIEKLNLDLGVFTIANLQEEMPRRLYSEIQKLLDEYRKGISKRGSFFENGTAKPGTDPADGNKNKDRAYTDKLARLDALLFFLRNGYLPWWAPDLASWDEHWLEQLNENEISGFMDFLASGNNVSILRLVSQFGDEFIQSLLKSMGIAEDPGKAWKWLKRAWEALQQNELREAGPGKDVSKVDYQTNLSPRYSFLPILRSRYWFQWMTNAPGKSAAPGLFHLLGDYKEEFFRFKSFFQSRSRQSIDLVKEAPGTWKAELELLRMENLLDEKDRTGMVPGDLPGRNIAEPGKEAPVPGPGAGEPKTRKNKTPTEKGEIFFVNEAGVILLHPFLPQLFRNCSWAGEDNFLGDFGKTMGVYALYYLATGNTTAPEHKLLLPKLLMGIPWEKPLEPVEPLNDIQKGACEELLTEVVKHWKALRNTSADGLREAYLQRPGKLEFGEGIWSLAVEHKTQDILLSRLPWGISFIKLPWMEGIVTVKWQ